MPISTKLTRALGIKHPLIQGGMHYVGYAPLVAAVSNAGGIGLVTALTQPSPEELQKEIRKTKSLTLKPFGVNLTLLPALKPPNYNDYADVVEEEMKSGQLRMIETAGHVQGLEPFVKQFQRAGAYIVHKCTQLRHAKSAERMGVDCISMDGFDCAGHPGEMDVGNWVLFAKAARELNIPFVASGGCADGKQLAAAIAMGAEGMNMGTRFIATTEAPVHSNIKQALIDADEGGTALIMRSMRNTERVFKNKAAEQVLEVEKEFPGDFSKIHHLVKGDNYRKVFQETGNIDEGVWSAGPVMGLIDKVLPCQDLLEAIVEEAEGIIRNRMQDVLVEDEDAPITLEPHWILSYKYVKNAEKIRKPFRKEHLKLVREFKSEGKLVMGGAHADLSGALIVFKDESSVDDFLAKDPYVLNNVVTSSSKREWACVKL